ncbi:MAG TPA: rod shape-determining protein MreD [Candidatus Methylomirabilis sp.]|jgi:rod shape-determining protein MreD
MKPAAFLLALVGVCVVQGAGGTLVTLAGVQPDLFLILAVGASLGAAPEAAALMGFLAGLYQDALSGAPLGLRAFTLTLMAFGAARVGRELEAGRPAAQFALLLGGAALAGVITLATLSFFFGPPPLLATLFRVMVPETLLTAGLGTALLGAARLWRVVRKAAA